MSKPEARVISADAARNRVLALVFAAVALALVALAVAATHPQAARAGSSAAGTPATAAAADETTPPARPFQVLPPSKGAYIGVFRPPVPYNSTALTSYKKIAGKPAAMVMWFQPWASNGANRFDAAMAVSVWKRGAVPIIVWEPWRPGDKPHNLAKPADMPDWQLSKIAAGQYDAYITQFARDVKAGGGPVMISLFHEMNGRWYPWCGTVNGNSPATFIAAYRHVHDIFVSEGATNVTWVWSVNFECAPKTYSNRWAAYYPGDEYVDWVAVSGFNWGQGCGGGPWKSFETLYRLPLRYLRTLHKPVMISEVGSVEKGGNKSAWLTDAFRRIRTAHPEVKAVIYYDAKEKSHKHTQDWRINSSKKSLKSYRKAVGTKYFVGSQAAALTSWRNSLTAEQWAGFLATKRIY